MTPGRVPAVRAATVRTKQGVRPVPGGPGQASICLATASVVSWHAVTAYSQTRAADPMSSARRQQIEELLRSEPGDPFLRYALALENAAAGQGPRALEGLLELL